METDWFGRPRQLVRWRPDDLLLQAVALLGGLATAVLTVWLQGLSDAFMPQPLWLVAAVPVIATGLARGCNWIAITLGTFMALVTTAAIMAVTGLVLGTYLLFRLFDCLPGWGSC